MNYQIRYYWGIVPFSPDNWLEIATDEPIKTMDAAQEVVENYFDTRLDFEVEAGQSFDGMARVTANFNTDYHGQVVPDGIVKIYLYPFTAIIEEL